MFFRIYRNLLLKKKIEPEEEPEKYEVVVNGLKRKLIIKKADPNSDRGRYECKCGVVVTFTQLFVKPALKFVKSLADLEGVEESSIDLEVEVTKPDQTCIWIRNGRTINPNESRWGGRYLVLSDGYKHTLSIKNLTLLDAGEFVIELKELSSKCNLKVREVEKVPRIDVEKTPKYIRVKSCKNVEIEVPYEGIYLENIYLN